MIKKAIYFDPDMWIRAQRKAGLTPLAAIIRRLLGMWLDGKINIENEKNLQEKL